MIAFLFLGACCVLLNIVLTYESDLDQQDLFHEEAVENVPAIPNEQPFRGGVIKRNEITNNL